MDDAWPLKMRPQHLLGIVQNKDASMHITIIEHREAILITWIH